MAKVSKKFDKGVLLKETTDAATLQGELRVDSASDELKIYLDGAERTVVSEDQVQTLTNKTIDVDNNTVSNIEVDNLKAGVLNTSTTLAGASDTQVPSALATKTYVDNAVAGVDQASEIDYSNATSGLAATDVQAAIDEVDAAVDDLNTLSGVVKNAEDLGTFTGTTIPDSSTIKAALQALETSVETKALASDLSDHLSDAVDAHDASAISNVPSGNLVATDVQGALNELQTDVDTRALNSDLTTHTSASSGVHGVTGSVVGTTDSQTLTNKTLTSPTINGGQVNNADINLGTASDTQKLVVSKDTFANLNALTREEGSVYYATDLDKLYVDDGSVLNAVGSGGQGGINHIDNPDFEVDASGWATYADAAASTPADATGGSPTITFTRSTSSPLRGLASGLLSKAAANKQGEGVSYAFTIDTADQAKMLEISFDYTVTTNFVDGDMRVFIYDVTNAQLIEPTQRDILANSGQATYRGYFQANSNSTSYRLVLHVATTSALAYDVKLDNAKVGPVQAGNAGTFVSDWQAYTPTFTGFGTPTSVNFYSRRVGDTLEIQGTFVAGTVTATEARVSFPSGLVGSSLMTSIKKVGSLARGPSESSDNWHVLAEPSVGYVTFSRASVGTSGFTKIQGASFSNTDSLGFYATIPIQGWSTGVSASEIPSNSVIAFRLVKTSGQAVSSTSATKVTFTSTSSSEGGLDFGGGADTSNSRWVAPESGLYKISSCLDTSNTDAGTGVLGYIYKNGSVFYRSDTAPGTGTSNQLILESIMNLNKGDIIEIYVQSKGGDSSYTVVGNPGFDEKSYFEGFKINSPSAISPTEVVAASYATDAGLSIPTGTTTNVVFEDLIQDTHGAMNTSTGIYTVPVSGTYLITAKLTLNANTNWTVGETGEGGIRKNGTIVARQLFTAIATTASNIYFSTLVTYQDSFNRGDTIQASIFQNSGAANTLLADIDYNQITIARIK